MIKEREDMAKNVNKGTKIGNYIVSYYSLMLEVTINKDW